MFHFFPTFTFEPGTDAGNQHLKLSKGCRKDSTLFGHCPELCFATDLLHGRGEITRTLGASPPRLLLAVHDRFRYFIALMELGGGHRNTFEGSLCAGLKPSCQKISALALRVSKRSKIPGRIRKNGAEDGCD